MRSKLIALACLSALAACMATPAPVVPVAVQSPESAIEELLTADRAFSAASADKDFVDSVAQMLAPGAVMPSRAAGFSVGPAAIVATLRSYPDLARAKASWAPVRGGVSADGMHGFTYGFMTMRRPDKADERLKYLSYWVKGADGWRVAAFKRARSGEGSVSTEMRPPALPRMMVAPTPELLSEHQASLIAAEKRFSDDAQAIGVGPAFVKNGSSDAMNMGAGADFTYGSGAIGTAVAGPGPQGPGVPIYWSADEGALVASSGDLGVTWGWIRWRKPESGQPDKVPFFTVWRRNGPTEPWLYVAE